MKIVITIIAFLVLLFPMISYCQTSTTNSTKRTILTENAPPVIGPFSQGNVAGGFLFTSGQLPIHPKTGVVPETIEEQTKLVLENLQAIIIAAGSSMDKVVKCTVYLQNFSDFAAMNKIYASYFPQNPPARVCVEVSKMAKNALVEIDAIAIVI
jgi:2-iminobutanoate/2-iminopropanoate deaminase